MREKRLYHKHCSCELHKLKHNTSVLSPAEYDSLRQETVMKFLFPLSARVSKSLTTREESISNRIKTKLAHAIIMDAEFPAEELEAKGYTVEL